jgi:16S rRNA (adenine1518-N6/adenine1519-N6)-dimethyltransferase
VAGIPKAVSPKAMRTTTTDAPRARKRFGQHFLEPAWVAKLVRAIEPSHVDTFLEIGPGRGALTRPLAAGAGHVVAFEIDRVLAEALRAAELPRLTVVEGDFLEVTLDEIRNVLSSLAVPPAPPALPALTSPPALPAPPGLPAPRIRVAGNLPYNVASPILFRLVDLYAEGLPVADATVMLQREVADRLLAAPGSREYGVLAVMLGRWAHVDRLLSLPPGAFRPAPKVHSSVVRLRFHPAQPPATSERVFRAMTQAVFTRRRKTLANALLAYPPTERLRPADALARAGIDGRRRPETLEIEEFVRLADVFTMGV